jgi:tetratricopeptide (TPR) repeat protein
LTEAIRQYERALQLKLDNAEIRLNLGVALAKAGRLPEAVQQFNQALQLKPDFAEAQLNLGDTLVKQGKTAEAIPHFQKALDLATARDNSALAEIIRARINVYEPASQPQQPQTP